MEDKTGFCIEPTISYYDENADSFVESTLSVDMSVLYDRFESYLQDGDRILDLGCGSGRDSRYFSKKGYRVVAVDPSIEMCKRAREIASITVYQMCAEDLRFIEEFDAIWACASLLHVKKSNMQDTMNHILTSLKNGGVMYASWKYGEGERVVDGRYYSDYTENDLELLIEKIKGIEIMDTWMTQDVRKERKEDKWINVILKKQA